ncbi:MAG: pilus assembly protein PilM [Fusobacteriaceae bacterium]|nr:pilus assembly protein PilM [Fusobacteriaceae bacterium]
MNRVYALDVGTRNVVLLSAVLDENNKIKIEHMFTREHETRAMEDGQIHDIAKVSEIVNKLKEDMKSATGDEVTEVAVAVAGRSLLTDKGFAKKDFNPLEELSEDDIKTVELLAIQDSLMKLKDEASNYHCVGYTVSEYKLDGVAIKNPLFQKGNSLETEILATFLPKVVVDSMYTTMKKIGLGIKTLTLEPIAAISVVIPEDMRKLNIALVDIGAGTSDIAISKGGRIIGYGMVPMAGDEITETILDEYLLDFNVAELVKKALSDKNETVKYEDILGMEYEIDKTEIFEKIERTLETLSEKIAQKIGELNETQPQAVILIGGGSLVPGLKEKIAEKVSLVAGRVAIRGTEAIKNLVDDTEKLKTAEFVTPIGIANMAFDNKGFNILEFALNNESHRVFSFTKDIKLMEALIAIGFDSKELYSMPGKALTFTVNGKMKILKGEMGKHSIIKINGKQKTLDNFIEDGDSVEIKKPREGRDAIMNVKEFLAEYGAFNVYFNGAKKVFYKKVYKNGEALEEGFKVEDRDNFEVKDFTVENLFDEGVVINSSVKFSINGKDLSIDVPLKEVKVNGVLADYTTAINENDRVEITDINDTILKVGHLVENVEQEFKILVNEQELVFSEIAPAILKNGVEVDTETPIFTGDKIETGIQEEKNPIVSDIFKYFSAEELLGNPNGMLQIEINSEKGEFTTKLKANDRVRLYYKN